MSLGGVFNTCRCLTLWEYDNVAFGRRCCDKGHADTTIPRSPPGSSLLFLSTNFSRISATPRRTHSEQLVIIPLDKKEAISERQHWYRACAWLYLLFRTLGAARPFGLMLHSGTKHTWGKICIVVWNYQCHVLSGHLSGGTRSRHEPSLGGNPHHLGWVRPMRYHKNVYCSSTYAPKTFSCVDRVSCCLFRSLSDLVIVKRSRSNKEK